MVFNKVRFKETFDENGSDASAPSVPNFTDVETGTDNTQNDTFYSHQFSVASLDDQTGNSTSTSLSTQTNSSIFPIELDGDNVPGSSEGLFVKVSRSRTVSEVLDPVSPTSIDPFPVRSNIFSDRSVDFHKNATTGVCYMLNKEVVRSFSGLSLANLTQLDTDTPLREGLHA